MSRDNTELCNGYERGHTYTVTARRAANRPPSTFVGVYVKPMRGGQTQVFTSTASGFDVELNARTIVSVEEVAK